MDNQNETVNQTPPPRTSRLAIASFVMGLVSLVTCVLWPILALPAIICGIIALVKISGANGMLKGKGYAITGIVLPAVMIILIPILAMALAILMPALNKTKHIAQRVICGTNLKGVGTALIVYTNDNNKFPPADQWCDLLIQECDVSPKSLICPSSDAIEGESTYAININAAGKDAETLPDYMVLLFETEAGIDSNGRTENIQNRGFFQFFEKQGDDWLNSIKNNKVYPNRWNQSGGPEILSMLYHKGEGCNVLFADGHSEYVPSNEIPHLRWTADANSMN